MLSSKKLLVESTGVTPVYHFLVFQGSVKDANTRCIYASENKQTVDNAKPEGASVHGWMVPEGFDPRGKTVEEISRKCRFVI